MRRDGNCHPLHGESLIFQIRARFFIAGTFVTFSFAGGNTGKKKRNLLGEGRPAVRGGLKSLYADRIAIDDSDLVADFVLRQSVLAHLQVTPVAHAYVDDVRGGQRHCVDFIVLSYVNS